ncbi:uncharacterized protein LOC121186321 isoform X2 [Toxotes jaculatrix]|uniref:uncharacterized protein LOC121186321 isoform X2 n=1 Tax=Toxotes jaculatrix TaxID=941984 RepID=UPI001B3AEC71|nr:uncharacterized protein LOC121186321 isoform X2 [Toxotes jaculatrix]
MVRVTISWAIVEALENLTKDAFSKFCHQLRDRREEPRVRRRDVEGKTCLEIADFLVSTFTEPGARTVTLEVLRQINCNQVADTLDSKTKACVDKGDPTFRKTSNGELETAPSQEAKTQRRQGHPVTVKEPEEVEAEARALVLSEGGDPSNGRLVLSRFVIQFGQYNGKTFKWLLENDVSYTAFLVASHQMEPKNGEPTMSQRRLMANKDSFTRYAMAYPEVSKEVRDHCKKAKVRSLQEGQALVGFGIYKSETLRGLYESKSEAKINYVQFLLGKKSTCQPWSKMEVAIRYILQRDQKRAAAARKRQTRGKRSKAPGP